MNIKELAEALNLSTATVSKALNNKSDISSHTRKKVLEAADRLGYRPNASARYLRSGKAETVAMLLPAADGDNILTASFFMRIASGLQRSLQASGIDPVLHITTDRQQELRLLQKIVEQKRADAILLTDTRVEDERIVFLAERQFPFVTMGQSRSLSGQFNWVDFNHELLGEECVACAMRKGARRIAVVTLGQESMHGSQFLTGCLNALRNANLPQDQGLIYYGDKTELSGFQAANHFMQQAERPDFIIFINDFQLMGASSFLSSLDSPWLKDNALICAIESSDFSSRVMPSACLFAIDHDEVGYRLGEAVLRATAGESEAKSVVLALKAKAI